MDKAKAAVSEFMHKAGHRDTTVHEVVNPAVTQETIKKTRHDEIQTAVDREVHVDHYHTTVQPVIDKEVLPEQHKHVMAGVQERHIDHGDDALVRRKLEEERAKFHDTRVEAPTIHTQAQAGTIAGEHVHHHVHETIQPVLQREVIQPSVVHTTVPIHEVHHKEPIIHSASALSAVSLSEFERQGGTLAGRGERVDGFEGEPKAVETALGGRSGIVAGTTPGHHSTGLGHHGTSGTTGVTGSSGLSHHGTTGTTGASGYGDRHVGTDGPIGSGHNTTGTGSHSTGPVHKSGLLNKLDPRVDSDGDGRSGVGK
ncbi:MAG: hypothetical protein M1816_000707 [Peltula sp. TS41687]|nr:MAG: hypothetical protein M1816_000707 [Peltula sp. TS41687]